ncbi:TetR/AcrR family transcriptional regulator [Actinoallomurus sp. NPDC052308]|uniref:TetR/AcrR family transcriptional regulator n=1 Tax=Actinoallomurus sp. NPDC052308 TaxID=3155530 RepID=UPI0034364DED
MTTEYSGSGDPTRTMELLWGAQPRPRRGPRPRLTTEQITRAAIEAADAEGLAALSMRRVAERLGVGAMSLYTYVPGKAELVDLMVDAVYGERSGPVETSGGWRERLAGVARANWALYRRHPWMLQVATVRPALGPNALAKYDEELRAVEGIGLTDVEMDAVLTLVLQHVVSSARLLVEAAEAQSRTGLTDEEWWAAHAPLLAEVFEADRYPVAARVGAAAGEAHQAALSPEYAFEFGLARILDGVGALVESRSA